MVKVKCPFPHCAFEAAVVKAALLNSHATAHTATSTAPATKTKADKLKHNQLKPGGPADVGKQSGCQRTKFKSVLNSDQPRRDLRRLNVGETIRMHPLEHGRREWAEATVHKALSSRSYDVITATGRHYRRNRLHLRPSRPSEHNTNTLLGSNSFNIRQSV